MNVLSKPTADETRARIAETAEALFRRLGFAKTTVADIAAELGMSPANVYRFFPSKEAIVETICGRCLAELEERSWAVARSRGSAAARLERLFLEAFEYNKTNLLDEKRVHDMVLVAIEKSWQTIQAHKGRQRAIVEFILRDGIESGEFRQVDPAETAQLILRAMISFSHPLMIAQCLEDETDAEAAAKAEIRFLLSAITPKE